MRCEFCKYLIDGMCDYIDQDDPKYPHNNSAGAGIKVITHDSSGLDVQLRVDKDFGCVKFTERKTQYK